LNAERQAGKLFKSFGLIQWGNRF